MGLICHGYCAHSFNQLATSCKPQSCFPRLSVTFFVQLRRSSCSSSHRSIISQFASLCLLLWFFAFFLDLDLQLFLPAPAPPSLMITVSIKKKSTTNNIVYLCVYVKKNWNHHLIFPLPSHFVFCCFCYCSCGCLRFTAERALSM